MSEVACLNGNNCVDTFLEKFLYMSLLTSGAEATSAAPGRGGGEVSTPLVRRSLMGTPWPLSLAPSTLGARSPVVRTVLLTLLVRWVLHEFPVLVSVATLDQVGTTTTLGTEAKPRYVSEGAVPHCKQRTSSPHTPEGGHGRGAAPPDNDPPFLLRASNSPSCIVARIHGVTLPNTATVPPLSLPPFPSPSPHPSATHPPHPPTSSPSPSLSSTMVKARIPPRYA